ncbi:hypothetical protein AB0H34_20765 [Saccharopolyspora shandongensis]
MAEQRSREHIQPPYEATSAGLNVSGYVLATYVFTRSDNPAA